MTKSLSYIAMGVAAGVTLAGVSEGALQAATMYGNRLSLFGEIFNKVRDTYAEKPDDDKLVKAAIDGMLASLDPHSTYFDPKALQDFQTSIKGEEFGGAEPRRHRTQIQIADAAVFVDCLIERMDLISEFHQRRDACVQVQPLLEVLGY